MPDKTNSAANTASRYPTLKNKINLHYICLLDESILIALLSKIVCRSMAITLEETMEKIY